MKSWKFKVGVVAVFLLGVVVGVAGTGLYVRHRMLEFSFNRPEQAVAHIMGRLTGELSLTDDQRQAIEPIVQDGFAKMRGIRNRLTPEVEGLMEENTRRLKEHLTPDQQVKLDRHNAEVLRRWREFAGQGGPPPPPTFGPAGGVRAPPPGK